MKCRSLRLSVAVVFMLALVGCAEQAKHRAVVADTGVYTALVAFHAVEVQLYESHQLTADQHQRINARLEPIVIAGRDLNRIVAAWPAGQPAPAEIKTLADQIRGLAFDMLTLLPDGSTKSMLLSALIPVESAVLALLTI